MSRAEIGTSLFIIVLITYGVVLSKILLPKKLSFYHEIAIGAPGVLIIVGLYAWLALGLPLLITFIFLPFGIIILALNAIFMKTAANWLSGFPSVQRWRKSFLRNRILSQQKRGRSALEIQKRGLIPDNKKLREFGFSELELKELGLMEKEE